MIIDSDLPNSLVSNYRAWQVSKLNRVSPRGICNVTLAQDKVNQHLDYIELDENGNIIGKWADYFETNVAPTSDEDDTSLLITTTSKITASGIAH